MSFFDFIKKKFLLLKEKNLDENKIRFCSNCGCKITDGSELCSQCGINIDEKVVNCDICNSVIPVGCKFCPNCGNKLAIIETKENNLTNDNSSTDSKDECVDLFSDIVETEDLHVDDNNNNNDQCVIMNEDIDNDLREILNFVNDNVSPGVYYSVIYGKYKQYFQQRDIFSFSGVKKVIDKYISDNCLKNDKFISKFNNEKEIKENIKIIIRDMKKDFSIFELSKCVPGIMWPLLEDTIKECEKLGIVKSINKEHFPRFIYISNSDSDVSNNKSFEQLSMNISKNVNRDDLDKIANELYNFILDILKDVNCEMISLNIVSSQLRIFKKDLFIKLKIDNDIDSLSNFIRKNLGGKLYVSKPFVSINPVRSSIDVTCDYLRTLDEFDKKNFDDFQNKIGLATHKSFELFIDKLSDEYVRVDVTKMIKKEIFALSDDLINTLSKNFNLFFRNNDLLDTSKFKAYAMFPKINDYQWNKYLLVGIIKTYFIDSYTVDNYGKTINDMNYIIRRKNDE